MEGTPLTRQLLVRALERNRVAREQAAEAYLETRQQLLTLLADARSLDTPISFDKLAGLTGLIPTTVKAVLEHDRLPRLTERED